MPKKKHKFIDKKNAVSFHLVHRSQKDPLQADEDAPQRVLVTGEQPEPSKLPKKDRLAALGVFFDEDDDYDYEQHMRDTGDLNKVEPDTDYFKIEGRPKAVQLPSSVLPSKAEEKVGMLNKAAPTGPKLDWDPDIVAALDSDFDDDDPDNELNDDFITLAMRSDDEFQSDDEDLMEDTSDTECVSDTIKDKWIQEHLIQGLSVNDGEQHYAQDEYDEARDDVDSLPDFAEEETKSRFTNYSMSSSVIRRNEGLTLVDDKFEQLYAGYDDDELGALDHEDIDGKVSTTGPLMEQLLREFEVQQILTKPDLCTGIEDVARNSEESSSEEELDNVDIPAEQKWDCESILSTYSNLYNHPKVIEEPWKKKKSGQIELTKKLGIPVASLPQRGLTRKQMEELDREDITSLKVTPVRDKNETPEERRLRKAMVKEDRRDRRMEKKNTTKAFKTEEAMQKKAQIQTKNNLHGKRIV